MPRTVPQATAKRPWKEGLAGSWQGLARQESAGLALVTASPAVYPTRVRRLEQADVWLEVRSLGTSSNLMGRLGAALLGRGSPLTQDYALPCQSSLL